VALSVKPRVSGLVSAVAWLRDHDVPTKRIAGLLDITETNARQLAYRGQWEKRFQSISKFERLVRPPADPFEPVSDELRTELKVRPSIESHTVRLDPAARLRLSDLEERVEELGATFWSGVPHGVGIRKLQDTLIEIGRPAHYRRIRILARLRQLLAETYAHTGYSATAVNEAIVSLLLSKASYDESSDPVDLKQFARTALIISQGHLLRREPQTAAQYLDLYRDAHTRIGVPLGAEYSRQRGAVAFQLGPTCDEEARRNFKEAARLLEMTVEYGRPKQRYEVLTIGLRQMNLLGKVDWDAAQQLLDYILRTLRPGEIHISMNVNWTAACGFSTDSPSAHEQASELLIRHRDASVGFGHQATVAWLLSLTPALPPNIRSHWVRHALYENTFRNH
jgi:hypothetical protein